MRSTENNYFAQMFEKNTVDKVGKLQLLPNSHQEGMMELSKFIQLV